MKNQAKPLNIIVSAILFLLLWVSSSYALRAEIRVLHVNDFHGFAVPYRPLGSDELRGGIAYLAAEAEKLRHEKPSLFLAAGDMIQGDNWANLFKGESVIDAMNAMGFDAMVIGNHEFDFGQQVLRKRISEALFPVLCANVDGLSSVRPYVIKNIGGVRIAVLGIVTPDVPLTTDPRNVAGLTFEPQADIVSKYIGMLKGEYDIMLVLSHIGYPNDRALAEGVKGIDIIVGGHSHTKLSEPATVEGTIIVQAWEHALALGVLDVTVEDGKIAGYRGYLDEIKPAPGAGDQRVAAVVDKYERKVDAVLNEKIGTAETDLDGDSVRRKETNLGDLLADVIRETAGADVAIINGGGIRTSIRKGEIRVKDVYSVLPFNNYIVAVRLTGRQIREALEYGVSAVEAGEGRFPQVSGIKFEYSISSPPGDRVRNVDVQGNPIEVEKEYSVATNDFLAAGGDGYRTFGEAVKSSKDFAIIGGAMKGDKLLYNDSGRWLRDVVIDYVKRKKMLSPEVEGRITELP